jgi:hypothetical protein
MRHQKLPKRLLPVTGSHAPGRSGRCRQSCHGIPCRSRCRCWWRSESNRAEKAGRAFNDVLLAGDAGPVDHTILTLLGDGLVGRNAQDRLGIGGVGAGDVLLPVAGAIAVRIGGGLGEEVIHGAEVTEPPGVGDAVIKDGAGTIGQQNQARESLLGNEAMPLGDAEAWSK